VKELWSIGGQRTVVHRDSGLQDQAVRKDILHCFARSGYAPTLRISTLHRSTTSTLRVMTVNLHNTR
jgi:hypothetical protein